MMMMTMMMTMMLTMIMIMMTVKVNQPRRNETIADVYRSEGFILMMTICL